MPAKKGVLALLAALDASTMQDSHHTVPIAGLNLGSHMARTEGTTGGKKKNEAESKTSKASAIINDLKSRYPGRVYRGSEYTAPWLLKRLPTGILSLDIGLNGGLPAGGFTMIYGPQGIGKNWLANQVIAHQQAFKGEDANIAVVSTEMIYDKSFAKSCGVSVGFSPTEIDSMDRAFFEASGEHLTEDYKDELRTEMGTFLTVPPGTAEQSFDIVLDLVESREFDVIVIDSFGSLLTEEDEEKDMIEGARVGGSSMVNTRFARKLNAVFGPDSNGRPNMTCLIGINQVRDNMDRANKYSPKTQETGGWALKHARWVGIELSHAGKYKEGETVKGKTVRWQITKQKAGGHEGAEGTYDFIWGRTGIWRPMESLRAAVDLGVVDKAGAWLTYNGERIGQGMLKAAAHIEEHKLLQQIETECLRKAGVHCNYQHEPDAE